MRITHCHIDAFGRFQDQSFEDLDHPLVVIEGPNEAGKTSLFRFFKTMLYGIEPVETDTHAYVPRGRKQLGGRMDYRLRDGAEQVVRRRLDKAPQGWLADAEAEIEGEHQRTELRNRMLPAVTHVPRDIFSAVYAVERSNLATLSERVWQEVQEQLLSTLGVEFVRPAHAVIEELEREAAACWQPAQHGSSEAQRLETRRQALREEAQAAFNNDQRLRILHDEIAGHTRRLQELSEERTQLKARLRQAERLGPVYALVKKMRDHERRAGDLDAYSDLPDDPQADFRALIDAIEQNEKEVAENEKALAEAHEAIAAFTDSDDHLLQEEAPIRAWGRKISAYENRLEQLEQVRRSIERISVALKERADRFLARSWDSELASAVRALPKAEMHDRIRAYEEANAEVEDMRVRADTLAMKVDRRQPPEPWLAAAGLGLVGLVVGIVIGETWLLGIGPGLMVAGLLQAYAAWSYNRERTERLGELDLKIEELKDERDKKGAAITEVVGELPIAGEDGEPLDLEMVNNLRDFKRLLDERDTLQKQGETLTRTLTGAQKEVRALAERCGYEDLAQEMKEGRFPEVVTEMETNLDAAATRRREAAEAEKNLETLEKEQGELEEALQERYRQQGQWRRLLEEIGEGDLAAGIDELKSRRQAAERARQARETLFQDYPNWEELLEELQALKEEEESWAYTDEEIVRMKERREEAATELMEEEQARSEKRREVQRLNQKRPADLVESEIAIIDERLQEQKRRRDHLLLLAGVVRRADHLFHLRHQPEVIKQASRYLQVITEGRYERLALEDGARRLCVYRAGSDASETVGPPISQGTLDQIYLAFRFAAMDQFDGGQEPLPVFLDEAFAGWDAERCRQGFNVLQEMLERRQVFVFTSQSTLAEELEQREGSRRIILEKPAVEALAEDLGPEENDPEENFEEDPLQQQNGAE